MDVRNIQYQKIRSLHQSFLSQNNEAVLLPGQSKAYNANQGTVPASQTGDLK